MSHPHLVCEAVHRLRRALWWTEWPGITRICLQHKLPFGSQRGERERAEVRVEYEGTPPAGIGEASEPILRCEGCNVVAHSRPIRHVLEEDDPPCPSRDLDTCCGRLCSDPVCGVCFTSVDASKLRDLLATTFRYECQVKAYCAVLQGCLSVVFDRRPAIACLRCHADVSRCSHPFSRIFHILNVAIRRVVVVIDGGVPAIARESTSHVRHDALGPSPRGEHCHT